MLGSSLEKSGTMGIPSSTGPFFFFNYAVSKEMMVKVLGPSLG